MATTLTVIEVPGVPRTEYTFVYRGWPPRLRRQSLVVNWSLMGVPSDAV